MDVIVEQLTKRFTTRGVAAVSQADFVAPSGGITTLLGPSGSGKTTVLRIIAGLETADGGRVLVDGEDVSRIPVRRRGFGFVFQSFALFNHMTVRDNIAFGLRARRTPPAKIPDRVAELLALVQLQEYADRYPLQLSGGQRQRVGFARALAPNPRLLLLDEPFGALDTRVRIELREWLRQLHEATHVTTLLVTHDQEEALDLSDRIVVMDHGRVAQVGSPQDVYESPATSFVASFIGAANVLHGTLRSGQASIGPLSLPAPSNIPEGAPIRAVVRPHDIRVLPVRADAAGGAQTTSARIRRMVNLGGFIKLELSLPSQDSITVHVPRREFAALALALDETVFLDLNDARVFQEDYVI